MKWKLTSILLALALCLALSTSTVASEAEEPPAPEEALADLIESERELEPGKWYVQERKFFSLPPTTNDELKALIADLIEREGELDPEKTYVLKTEYVHLDFDDLCQDPAEADTVLYGIAAAQAEEGPCPECGKDNWGPATDRNSGLVNVNDVIHGEYYSTVYTCRTAGCGYVRTTYKLKQAIPHSWSVSSLSISDSDSDHVATCAYTCECGATKDVPLTAEALADLIEREGPITARSQGTVIWGPPIWTWGDNRVIDINQAVGDHAHHFIGKELVRTWDEGEGEQHQKWAEYRSYCVYGCGAYSTLCEPVGDDVTLPEDTEAPVPEDVSKTTCWTWVTP